MKSAHIYASSAFPLPIYKHGGQEGPSLDREAGNCPVWRNHTGIGIYDRIWHIRVCPPPPQFVLAYVGSPGASLVIWAFSGLVTMCAALCYAELGTVVHFSSSI